MKHKFIIGSIIVLAVILLVPAIWYFYETDATTEKSHMVEILQDGKVIDRIDLAAERGARTFTIPYGEHHNTIEIKDHTIRVSEADCPDQICVHMGTLTPGKPPIVCLPHHLVIRYADQRNEPDSVVK